MIRNIKQNDLKKCAEILEKEYSKSPYFEQFKDGNSGKYIESKYKNNAENCFVIEENKEIIGFCFFSLSCWSNGLQGIIEEIVINSDFQGKGYGKKLYNFIENELKIKGVKSLILWVQNDTNALYFHQKNGFKKSEEHFIMFKNL